MAGTAKVLNDINYSREEISHIVDLLSRRHPTKAGITCFIKERPLDTAVFIIILGVFAALFSGKIKNLLKLALLFYATKQSISHLLKK